MTKLSCVLESDRIILNQAELDCFLSFVQISYVCVGGIKNRFEFDIKCQPTFDWIFLF